MFHASGLTAPLKAAKSISVRVVSKGVKGKKQVSKVRARWSRTHYYSHAVLMGQTQMASLKVCERPPEGNIGGTNIIGKCFKVCLAAPVLGFFGKTQ